MCTLRYPCPPFFNNESVLDSSLIIEIIDDIPNAFLSSSVIYTPLKIMPHP